MNRSLNEDKGLGMRIQRRSKILLKGPQEFQLQNVASFWDFG